MVVIFLFNFDNIFSKIFSRLFLKFFLDFLWKLFCAHVFKFTLKFSYNCKKIFLKNILDLFKNSSKDFTKFDLNF